MIPYDKLIGMTNYPKIEESRFKHESNLSFYFTQFCFKVVSLQNKKVKKPHTRIGIEKSVHNRERLELWLLGLNSLSYLSF